MLGVEEHLDDASLHQFVNGKTQRPVEFSYHVIQKEGATIGSIEIPVQKRPTYLKKRFDGLGALEVFIRDGSSTRTATPEEIARVGAEEVVGAVPELDLEWTDLDARHVLPSPKKMHSLILSPRLPPETFTRRRPHPLGTDPFSNPHYSREIIAYAADRALLTALGLRLRNTSSVVGRRIRFIGHVVKSDGIFIQDWFDGPPIKNRLLETHISESMFRTPHDIDLSVRELGDRWEIEVDFGDVRPRDEAWTTNGLFIGSTNPGVAKMEGELRGDNLPQPIKCELEVHVEVERRAMAVDDIAPYWERG